MRSPRFATAASAVACLLVLAGCFGQGPERSDKLSALARWEDRREAPEDSLVALLRAKTGGGGIRTPVP